MLLAVLIPVYNEARLGPRAIERLLATPEPMIPITTDDPRQPTGHAPVTRRLYIVDDGSTDGTLAAIERATAGEHAQHIRLFKHPVNRGKGAAVRTALAAALADGADAFLIQDADLEYDPRDHQRLLDPMLDGRADAVIGSRFMGDAHRVLYYWHYVANRFITTASNMCTNLNLSDIECCLKAFTREVAEQLKLEEERFGIEPELVAKIARAKVKRRDLDNTKAAARIFEVAVTYCGRTYAEGKKITWHDGLDALRCIVTHNLLR